MNNQYKPSPFQDTGSEGSKMEEWVNMSQLRQKKEVQQIAPSWHLPTQEQVCASIEVLNLAVDWQHF